MKNIQLTIDSTDVLQLGRHSLFYGQRRTGMTPFKDEAVKISVKDRFMDFIDEHTNSHGVFICGSKKLVDFINENLI